MKNLQSRDRSFLVVMQFFLTRSGFPNVHFTSAIKSDFIVATRKTCEKRRTGENSW